MSLDELHKLDFWTFFGIADNEHPVKSLIYAFADHV
jgi:hypothetical protein